MNHVRSSTRFRCRLAFMIVLLLAASWLPDGPLLPRPALAQSAPARFGVRNAIGSARYAEGVAIGDVNRDGWLDVVQVNTEPYPIMVGPTLLYINNGTAEPFRGVIGTQIGAPGRYQSVTLADMDGDGWLDLVRGGPSRTQIFFGLGSASQPFTDTPVEVGQPGEMAPVVGDFDQNGWLDLVAGGELLLNDGTVPLFGTAIPQPLPLVAAASPRLVAFAVADLTGDGYLDLVACGASLALYTNSKTSTPFDGASRRELAGNCRDVALGDMDGNGTLDIVATASGPSNQAFVFVWPNDGSSTPFSGAPDPVLGAASSIEALDLADHDADGDLDIVVANNEAPGRVLVNTGNRQFTPVQFGDAQPVGDIAVGDIDRDGDPDVVLASMGGASSLLVNTGAYNPYLASEPALFGDPQSTQATALGDIDGQGGIDLVETTRDQVLIYLNAGGDNPYNSPPQTLPLRGKYSALALGDVNGDNRLDLLAANNLYLNNGSPQPFAGVTPQSIPDGSGAWYAAFGDFNNDGALDLIHSDYVYINNRTQTPFSQPGQPLAIDLTSSSLRVAVGDLDRDGDLDLVRSDGAPRSPRPVQIFLNSGGDNPFSGVAPLLVGPQVVGGNLLLSDLNGDGMLDLMHTPFVSGAAQLFFNNGTREPFKGAASVSFGSGQTIAALRAGDIDHDGDTDLVIGRTTGAVDLLRNNGSRSPFENVAADSVPANRADNALVELGDFDGDGALDLLRATTGARKQLLSSTLYAARTANQAPRVQDVRLGETMGASLYGTSAILSDGVLPVYYTLSDAEGDRVQRIRASYSLDGGGSWRPAKRAGTGTDERLLAFPTPTSHYFAWDVWADGDAAAALLGQSDNLVFRIEADPSYQAPSAFSSPLGAGTSLSYRVRGTLPQVLKDGAPLPGAYVFRLPKDAASGATLMLAHAEPAAVATAARNGLVHSRDPLMPGDRLVAVQELQRNDEATIYLTSAAPTAEGLAAQTVNGAGVQTLNVSPSNVLVALYLRVSLEWDARADTAFMERLKNDLLRTSNYLYDWTDGQIALGTVLIYQNKEQWYDVRDAAGRITRKGADVRIYATNRLRPSASQGGVARQEFADPDAPEQVYEPGPVQIGAVWNRDGSPVELTASTDWPRALAHELGHYALFLDDNYLGLDNTGQLLAVAGCPGAMSDPYRDDYSEFHPAAGWSPNCDQTLSQRTSGRSDWQTITRFYSSANGTLGLRAPATFNANPGPSVLPLAVTQFIDMPANGTAAPSPALAVAYPAGTEPSPAARALLFRGNAAITDLGQPALGQVAARGAGSNDRVCVFDAPAGLLGCARPNAGTLTLQPRRDWQPDVVITDVTSRSVSLSLPQSSVGMPLPSEIEARVFPLDSTQARKSVLLTRRSNESAYTGTIRFDEPVTEAAIHVFVADDTTPQREVVTEYTLGGNPAPTRRPRPRSRRRSPMTSADGSMVLFADTTHFDTGQFFTIQTATALPTAPPTAVPIGPGYRLLVSQPDLFGRPVGLTLSYAIEDVPPRSADGVAIYYQPPGGTWKRLEPRRSGDNELVAQAEGPGLYVVMASTLWQLPAGLEQYSYPGETTPMPTALMPLTGAYSHIYGYDASDADDPWKAYVPGAPEWVNTGEDGTLELPELVTGQNYWVNVTSALVAPTKPLGKQAAPQAALLPPPALFFDVLRPDGDFVPEAGQTITAVVDGKPCASTLTRQVGRDVVFVIDVPGAGCGFTGASVHFVIGDYTLPYALPWDRTLVNGRVVPSLFLPLTTR
jgi:hypothetical protein